MLVSFDDLPTYRDHVLVDGAFDPLHAGHLAYLAAARAHGPLLCAVASDEQIREKCKVPFLPQSQRVEIMASLGMIAHVHAKDRPTEQVLEQMRPKAYVKGLDWKGKLPPAQMDVLERYQIPVCYLQHDLSGVHGRDLLGEWATAEAELGLQRMEWWIDTHKPTPPEAYDAAYFNRDGLPYKYTLDQRRIAEGARPDRIKDLWPNAMILDVGCGPGCLIALLRERGVRAYGIEPSKIPCCLPELETCIYRGRIEDVRSKADVVISREVLEHLTIPELTAMVGELFRAARQAVYITTRFHKNPRTVFDVTDQLDVDPTHQTLLTHQLLRALCVMHGGKHRPDWERHLDFQGFGCTLAYEVRR